MSSGGLWGRLVSLGQKVRAGAKPHFVVLDLKRQSLDDLRGQTLHEKRKAGDLSHIKKHLTGQNIREGYGGHDDDPRAAVKAYIEGKGVKVDKRNTRPCLSMVLSTSHEYFGPDPDPEKVAEWASQSMAWAYREFGEDVVHYSLHLDEKTPHLHVKVVPTYEKKTKRQTVRQASHHKHKALRGRNSYGRLLDRYSEAMAPLGLLRGERVPDEAGRTHQSARQWVNAMARRWSGRAKEMALLDERERQVGEREAAMMAERVELDDYRGELVAYADELETATAAADRHRNELSCAALDLESHQARNQVLAQLRQADKSRPDLEKVKQKRPEKRTRRSSRKKGKAPADLER